MSERKPIVTYDDFPYPSLSYSLTHPDRIATVATLFGLEPVNVENCRYLDIGCAVGGNLFPLAYTLPGSQFTGIDYARRQIEIGNRHLAELGLTNMRLEQMDIMNVPEDFGQFDYIVAHGIYSWVPEPVRDRLLEVIRQHLAPNGIAYISYNCYPGWHMLDMAREMMFYRIRGIDDLGEQVDKARELIDVLADSDYEDNQIYGAFLKTYRKSLNKKVIQSDIGGNSLILHDELSEVNDPVYFRNFVDHAVSHGLQYLSEVDIYQVSPARYSKETVAALGQMAKDFIDFEQYIDFLQHRTFRKTLLCHQEARVTRRLKAESVYDMIVSSYAEIVSEKPDLQGPSVEQFKGKDGAVFATDHPLTKTALASLIKIAPAMLTFDELLSVAAIELGIQDDENQVAQGKGVLAANLLRAYSYSESLLQVHVYRPTFVTQVSERPLASPVARWQANRFSKVTSMRHERVELDPVSRQIFMQLDGQHDRDEIAAHILKLFEDGTIVIAKEEDPKVAESLPELVAKDIDQNLNFFAWASMLIS